MLERLAEDARDAVLRGAQEAQELGSATIEAEHLLLALAADENTPTGRLLADCGLDHGGVRGALESETARSLAAVGVAVTDFALTDPGHPPRRRPKLATSSKRVLETALGLARSRKDARIAAPHLLVGILSATLGTIPRALDTTHVDRAVLLTKAQQLPA